MSMTRNINDLLTTRQIQEEVALSYLRETSIEDLMISLDNFSIQTLDKIQNLTQALLQDRMLMKAHKINVESQDV